ncbi:two-component system, OmpR family, sensor histidine kinase BraS/BceS [Staphylococcus auricularis]|nr:sensor histidine kinase [Staphylococcus auricularis]MDC6327127.1 sensor histidine kinase [Staphylococcus auricularis]MDN4533163.1 sensor histidine kinase [Staphylococcus auricularis]MDN4533335.1 sensor histidine kinase [Staphylococcus auricularis]QPT06231.1 sensor histidine kinase [Staphylococcus auricularis]SQJ17431.1 nisin susceptibility-associated sensor histidine kinase [Staphylococcus auricularis]
MKFINEIKNEIIIAIGILILFLVIFFVFSLPMEAFFLGAAIVLFILIIYWVIQFMNFKEKLRLKTQVDQLEDQLETMRREQIEYKNEIEAYFLTWVHQIKTPITASKLLLEQNHEDTVNRVRQEILQIDNYTNLALSYLKLINQQTDMVLMKVSIDDLIRTLIKKYSIQFIQNHTKVHYEKVTDEVLTDAKWASIMIEQILNNALKYARGKDIWIDFDSQQNQLKIADNGIGISQADKPKIFDRGYSGYNGRLNDKSSGIGLFIVKQIANRLQHKVEVESELNEGATFTITFPQQTT